MIMLLVSNLNLCIICIVQNCFIIRNNQLAFNTVRFLIYRKITVITSAACCVAPFPLVITVKTINIVHDKLPYQHMTVFRSVNTCKKKTVVGRRNGTRLVTALTLTKVTLPLNNNNIIIFLFYFVT